MRTAADFNSFYSVADPWKIERASWRDRTYLRFLPSIIRGKSVLELGCGEGHTTEALFGEAAAVTGVDISDVAIARARARGLRNARFETGDFLQTSFSGYDVVAAIECVYYLSPTEQETFFAKVAREHAGKTLLLSGPIIGSGKHRRYFTHAELIDTFDRHGLTVTSFHNITAISRAARYAARMAPKLLDWMPESAINQRLYIVCIR